MNTKKLKKIIIKALPYVLVGLVCTNLGEASSVPIWARPGGWLKARMPVRSCSHFSARWGQPSAILSRAFIPWISWLVLSSAALCTLRFISATKTPSTSNTIRNTVPPDGVLMRILSHSWIPSLRTT